jgi:hypothetical protein
MAVSIVRVPELFVGPPAAPEQVVRVTVAGDPGPLTVGVRPGTELTAGLSGAEVTVEVPVPLRDRPVGRHRGIAVVTVRGPAGEARADTAIPVAEPGWTAYLSGRADRDRGPELLPAGHPGAGRHHHPPLTRNAAGHGARGQGWLSAPPARGSVGCSGRGRRPACAGRP